MPHWALPDSAVTCPGPPWAGEVVHQLDVGQPGKDGLPNIGLGWDSRCARFWQEVVAIVDPGGTLLYGDLVLPGRTARSERHDYSYYQNRFTACRPDGTLLFRDTQALAPPPAAGLSFGEALPDGLDTVDTVYLLAGPVPRRAVFDAVRQWCLECGEPRASSAPALVAGCSTLPHECGVVVRFLAAGTAAGKRAMRDLATLVRRETLGAGPPASRKL